MSKNRENYVVVLKYPEILPELCYDGRIHFVTDSIEEAEELKKSFESANAWRTENGEELTFTIKKLVDV